MSGNGSAHAGAGAGVKSGPHRFDFTYPTRQAETSAGRVAYFDEGEGHPLIFLHGLVGEFTHFRHVAPAFARDYRVIGVDMPGCGQSCKDYPRHTLQSYADCVLEVMSRCGVERATLVGHSLGGLVSAEVALRTPEKVSRLVLVNSAGLRRYGRVAHTAARALLRPRLLEPTLEYIALPLLGRVFHGSNEYTRHFVDDALGRPRHPTLSEMSRVFRDFANEMLQPRILENAQRLAMPTLVLWGDRDRLVPLDEVVRGVGRMPSARLEIIRECGHMPIIEQPETVIRLVREFLASTEVRASAPGPGGSPGGST